MQTNASTTASTTIVDEPYEVVLAAAGRFGDDTIKVHQHAVLGDRLVVASASREGYWWIPTDPELTRGRTVPRAVFQLDPAASFTYVRTR